MYLTLNYTDDEFLHEWKQNHSVSFFLIKTHSLSVMDQLCRVGIVCGMTGTVIKWTIGVEQPQAVGSVLAACQVWKSTI